MKSTIGASMALLLSVAMAGPILGGRAAQSYSLAAYAPPAYAPPPPPAYSYQTSFATGSTSIISTVLIPTAISESISSITTLSTNFSLGSPVGITDTTSLLATESTTSLPLIAPFTVTLLTKSSSTSILVSSSSTSGSTVNISSTKSVPFATGSSTSLPLTAAFTVALTTKSSSTSSVLTSLTPSNYTTFGSLGSSIDSPVTATPTGTVPIYFNSTTILTLTSTHFVTGPASVTPSLSLSSHRNGTYSQTGTIYSTGSTLVSPVTASTNSTPTSSAGTVPAISYGTALVPYPYSISLSTGVSSSTGSREGSPVTASASKTFNSESGFPGTGSTTSTVRNLETFPSIMPDSTTSSATATPSPGFYTVTTVPALEPHAINTPYAYPLTTAYQYGGPGGYSAYEGASGGSWFGRLFKKALE